MNNKKEETKEIIDNWFRILGGDFNKQTKSGK